MSKVKRYSEFILEMDQYSNLAPPSENKEAANARNQINLNLQKQDKKEQLSKGVGQKPISDPQQIKNLQKEYDQVEIKRKELARQITDFEAQSKQEEIQKLQSELQANQQYMQQLQQRLKGIKDGNVY